MVPLSCPRLAPRHKAALGSVVMITVCLETFPSETGLGERVIKSYALLKVEWRKSAVLGLHENTVARAAEEVHNGINMQCIF